MTDLKTICKTLHLAHIIEEFEEVPFESKEHFLRDVLSIEVSSRQTTKISRLMKKAKFRELKWLKNYEWTEQIHLPATTSKEKICDLCFIKEKQNLLLMGTPGTGNYRKFSITESRIWLRGLELK
jgi:DNA replication protein DnaC